MSFVTIISLTFVILSVINGQTTTETPIRDCGPNAKYYICSRRCPYTCAMINEFPRHFCPGDCLRGCFCKPGYYRQSVTNLCVLPRDCNRTITP